MTTTVYTTREEWLTAGTVLLEPLFVEAGLTVGPARVSVGFPVGKGGRNGGKIIGQCHYAATDGVPQLFIHPTLTDPVHVLATLAHELTHAYLPVGTGHRKPFAVAVKALGLDGKPTATVPGDGFKAVATEVLDLLGEYPHAALDTSNLPKQGTRLIRCECDTCGFLFRTTRAWLDKAYDLRCPDVECEGGVTVG